jgi:hypothetical protein
MLCNRCDLIRCVSWKAGKLQNTHLQWHCTLVCPNAGQATTSLFGSDYVDHSVNILTYSCVGEHMTSGSNALLSKTCYKEYVREWRTASCIQNEPQIFSYRSGGLGGTLDPPNVSLWHAVWASNPVVSHKKHAPAMCTIWCSYCMRVTGEKEINVGATCHLVWTRRMSLGWNWHEMHGNWQVLGIYSRITFTKSPSFWTKTFGASLTKLTVFLPQSRDRSLYVSKRILAPTPFWLQKHTNIRIRVHDFTYSPDMWHQPRPFKVTCAWSWRLYGINHAINSAALRGL